MPAERLTAPAERLTEPAERLTEPAERLTEPAERLTEPVLLYSDSEELWYGIQTYQIVQIKYSLAFYHFGKYSVYSLNIGVVGKHVLPAITCAPCHHVCSLLMLMCLTVKNPRALLT